MAATYEPIASTTLGSDTATVTLGSGGTIPSTYTDLVLVINAWTSVNDRSIRFRVNGDTGNNYSRTNIIGYSGGAISQRASSTSAGYLAEGSSDAESDTYIAHFMSYANTNVYKTVLSSEASPSRSLVSRIVSLWRSSSAITSIEVYPGTGDFKAGSTFSLYGIKAA